MSFKNIIVKKGRNSDFLIICDHASNNIDEKYGNLGLEKKYINSHRAFDIVGNSFTSRVGNIIHWQDDHMVTNANPSVFAPIGKYFVRHVAAPYQRFVFRLWV